MKKSALYIASWVFMTATVAQDTVSEVLKQVEVNNKALQSNQKYLEARKAEFKTGLSLYDPIVEFDYLFGSREGAGNQRDFSITQRLDFPTAYKRKKQLSDHQITQTELQQQVYRLDVLLETKLLLLQVIYLNKKNAELNKRKLNTQNLVLDYQKKLDKGDVTILDVNKARLQLLNTQHEEALNNNERQILLTKLSEFNGGIEIAINDSTYPLIPNISEFEILDSTIEANDPIVKVYEQEKKIWQQQIALQKAMNLPKIEAGYHSQGILGQSYRGMHAGISIPLWENKNKLNATRSNLDYAASNAQTHRLDHRMENKRLYEQLDVRFKMMEEYKSLLQTLDNTTLLNKALTLGQITVVQYFYDASFYFTAYDKYLLAELEYHQGIAKLHKFML